MSYAAATAAMTGPGERFETTTVDILGVTFNLCKEVNLFENSHYNVYQRGLRSFYVGSTNWVGPAMNDKTSSIHINANF